MKPIKKLTLGVVTTVILILGTSAEVLADPPDRSVCGGDVYDRLDCKQAALADQMAYTADTVFAEGTKLHQHADPNRLAHITKANEKVQWAKRQSTPANFKRQAKAVTRGNKTGGHLVPFSSFDDMNNDGICDYEQGNTNADCAAIELDAFEQLQVCNPKKKNKGNGHGSTNPDLAGLECDRFFDSEDGEDMVEAAEQLEETYATVENDLIEMNEHLDAINASPPAELDSLLYRENETDSCDVPKPTPGQSDLVYKLRLIQAGLDIAADVASDWGSHVIVVLGNGGNSRSWAIPFHILSGAGEIAYLIANDVVESENAELQSAIMDCVNKSSGNVDQILAKVIELQNRLDETTGELTRLLHTPEGMRSSERPVCDGLPCSWPFIPRNWPDPPENE